MKKLVREILFLRRGERRALYTVSILLFLSLIFRTVIPNIGHSEVGTDLVFLEELELLRVELDSLEKARMTSPVRYAAASRESRPLRPRKFDPNTVSREELSEMFLSEKIISNLLNYRGAGAVFRSPVDLKKIYSMDDHIYDEIHDFVCIEAFSPKNNTSGVQAHMHKETRDSLYEVIRIELNAADSSDLVRIRGIGPFSARTIIRYRSLLGGYYELTQLKEVYGMDSSRYELLCRSVYIDSSSIDPLEINELTYGELLRHPYFSKQQVTDLIQYRDYANVIVSLDELEKFGIFDSASFVKIAPYIRCRIN